MDELFDGLTIINSFTREEKIFFPLFFFIVHHYYLITTVGPIFAVNNMDIEPTKDVDDGGGDKVAEPTLHDICAQLDIPTDPQTNFLVKIFTTVVNVDLNVSKSSTSSASPPQTPTPTPTSKPPKTPKPKDWPKPEEWHKPIPKTAGNTHIWTCRVHAPDLPFARTYFEKEEGEEEKEGAWFEVLIHFPKKRICTAVFRKFDGGGASVKRLKLKHQWLFLKICILPPLPKAPEQHPTDIDPLLNNVGVEAVAVAAEKVGQKRKRKCDDIVIVDDFENDDIDTVKSYFDSPGFRLHAPDIALLYSILNNSTCERIIYAKKIHRTGNDFTTDVAAFKSTFINQIKNTQNGKRMQDIDYATVLTLPSMSTYAFKPGERVLFDTFTYIYARRSYICGDGSIRPTDFEKTVNGRDWAKYPVHLNLRDCWAKTTRRGAYRLHSLVTKDTEYETPWTIVKETCGFRATQFDELPPLHDELWLQIFKQMIAEIRSITSMGSFLRYLYAFVGMQRFRYIVENPKAVLIPIFTDYEFISQVSHFRRWYIFGKCLFTPVAPKPVKAHRMDNPHSTCWDHYPPNNVCKEVIAAEARGVKTEIRSSVGHKSNYDSTFIEEMGENRDIGCDGTFAHWNATRFYYLKDDFVSSVDDSDDDYYEDKNNDNDETTKLYYNEIAKEIALRPPGKIMSALMNGNNNNNNNKSNSTNVKTTVRTSEITETTQTKKIGEETMEDILRKHIQSSENVLLVYPEMASTITTTTTTTTPQHHSLQSQSEKIKITVEQKRINYEQMLLRNRWLPYNRVSFVGLYDKYSERTLNNVLLPLTSPLWFKTEIVERSFDKKQKLWSRGLTHQDVEGCRSACEDEGYDFQWKAQTRMDGGFFIISFCKYSNPFAITTKPRKNPYYSYWGTTNSKGNEYFRNYLVCHSVPQSVFCLKSCLSFSYY